MDTVNTNNSIKTRETLIDNLYIAINKNSYEKALIKTLGMKFSEKGFSLGRANQIFSRNVPIESLNDIELILLTKELYSLLNDENIKPNDYFSEAELIQLENYTKPKNERKKSLVLKNVVQIDDLQWICPFWTLEEIYEARNNALLSYNFNTQREADYRETPSGEIIPMASLNKNSVKDISEQMYENKFTPNMVTLNIRLLKGKKPNYEYNKNTRELIITPDYDFNSPTTTYLDTTDGWHRETGAILAVERAKAEGKQLKGGLVASITCFTEEEARKYIAREAKRNDMSEEYTSALSDDDYNKVARMINDYGTEHNNILKDKIATTYNELQFTGKFTTLEVIREGLKLSDLNVKDPIDVKMQLPVLIDIMNTLVNHIIKYKFDNNIELVKEKTPYLSANIFAGYIAIANQLVNNDDYLNKIIEVSNKLSDLSTKDINDLGLNSKNLKQKKIYDYFKNLV